MSFVILNNQTPEVKPKLRFCPAIGMYAIDRGRASCTHRTKACRDCYNAKIYAQYKEMAGRDITLDQEWPLWTGELLAQHLTRKHKQVKRIRLMTRGEAFSTLSDIAQVKDLIVSNPGTIFWIPTRAWHDPEFMFQIEREILPLENARVMASIDVYTYQKDLDMLRFRGWSTMFFGNDHAPKMAGSYRCPKTWEGKHGACASCRDGCFSKERKDVWLKKH